ncbi:MAG: hypothetical protein RSC76_08700, partial [Oscillospiraceae bacterium]
MYRYEMHCHDRFCSACAHSTPEEMVLAYAQKGYDGLVFTNHFLGGNTAVDKSLPWAEKIDCYYYAYLRGKAAAPKGFTVLFGLEHRYENDGKEVLTYNITPEFLKAHPNLHLLPIGEYADLVHSAGGFLTQAHPYREAWFINPAVLPPVNILDALETFNFFNSPPENQKAEDFAAAHHLYGCSGGDIHDIHEPLALAGMAFPHPIHSSQDLVSALKSHSAQR